MTTETLTTNRLTLRRANASDAARITQCVSDPRVYEAVARIPPNQSEAATADWLATHADARAADTDHVFAITREDGPLLGMVGVHRTATHMPFELGYWLSAEAWGNGYMTEAASALITWLQNTRGHRLIVSGHFTDNPASGRVLSKLGFLKAGRGPVFCLGRGENVDHIFMARIAAA